MSDKTTIVVGASGEIGPAPVVADGDEASGTITATQAAASCLNAVHGDFTGRVLRSWGGLPRV